MKHAPERHATSTALTADVRAYAVPVEQPAKKTQQKNGQRHRAERPRAPRFILIFDTETSTDESQRLFFGSFRYSERLANGCIELRDEGLFYDDALPAENPSGFACLAEYARTHGLRLFSRSEFLRQVFAVVAEDPDAVIANFNLKFDLSRLAVRADYAKGTYYGGFSFPLIEYTDSATGERRESAFHSWWRVKQLDSKRALMGFANPRQGTSGRTSHAFRAKLLDVRTLVFALKGKSYSLAGACKAFGLAEGKGDVAEHGIISAEYIDYNRQDTRVTERLLEAALREFYEHPISRHPANTLSPASMVKGYLREIGIIQPMENSPTFHRGFTGWHWLRISAGVLNAASVACPCPSCIATHCPCTRR